MNILIWDTKHIHYTNEIYPQMGNFGCWGNFGHYKTFILSNNYTGPNNELIIMGLMTVDQKCCFWWCFLNLLGIKQIYLQMLNFGFDDMSKTYIFLIPHDVTLYRKQLFKVIHSCKRTFCQSFPMLSKVTPNAGVTLASNIFFLIYTKFYAIQS